MVSFGKRRVVMLFILLATGLFTINIHAHIKHTAYSKTSQLANISIVMDAQEIKSEITNSETKLQAEAEEKIRKLKVLCWVPVAAKNHNTSARVVMETWGKRCDRLVFMSSVNDPSIGAVNLGVKETYNNLWLKTRAALRYIYSQYLKDYDWFMKADDDTYVVVENLKYLLTSYDTNEPSILGSRFFTGYFKAGYMTGGAGYALSRAAISVFVEKALPDPRKCPLTWKKIGFPCEDVALAKCLSEMGVKFIDTRDNEGRGRFFQQPLKAALTDPKTLLTRPFYKVTTGLNCCSDTAVTFHDLSARDMYMFDYLLYELRPYGVMKNVKFPPAMATGS
ncbi:glycoprotein-N-acetylgalactosamine 3-beta-galactosyltransferase 1-like [Penaeus chinensis]|uniref:glycoprotein-N-acetylgalactosamine 3-beta-galactosyltransferase 1-like n=1 Tax=Penaeus chinensis TaxID=139456 RepID=UPI001FB5D726|nr:glycoprotein-N-acetylgalactosamine 3-beta-galactosyltransferase 1-like [Penaeus chinensis]